MLGISVLIEAGDAPTSFLRSGAAFSRFGWAGDS